MKNVYYDSDSGNNLTIASQDEKPHPCPPIPYYSGYTKWGDIHYNVGCNAVAMAQVMSLQKYPNDTPPQLENGDYTVYFLEGGTTSKVKNHQHLKMKLEKQLLHCCII